MADQKPTLGRTVRYHEGDATWPAIITRVWSDDCVNLTVFPDCRPPFWLSSVVTSEGASQRWSWPPRV